MPTHPSLLQLRFLYLFSFCTSFILVQVRHLFLPSRFLSELQINTQKKKINNEKRNETRPVRGCVSITSTRSATDITFRHMQPTIKKRKLERIDVLGGKKRVPLQHCGLTVVSSFPRHFISCGYFYESIVRCRGQAGQSARYHQRARQINK